MEQQIITLRKLVAEDEMTLFNGKAFGKEVYLGENDSPENWQEIPDEEALRLQKEMEERE